MVVFLWFALQAREKNGTCRKHVCFWEGKMVVDQTDARGPQVLVHVYICLGSILQTHMFTHSQIESPHRSILAIWFTSSFADSLEISGCVIFSDPLPQYRFGLYTFRYDPFSSV